MPILRGHCGKGKPLTPVGLAPALPRPGGVTPALEIPQFPVTRLMALLDTGADGTCITSATARSHNLERLGLAPVVGIGGVEMRPTWGMFLCFYFDQEADFEGDQHQAKGLFMIDEPLVAVDIPLDGEFDVIVGRDILQKYGINFKPGGEWEMVLSDGVFAIDTIAVILVRTMRKTTRSEKHRPKSGMGPIRSAP